MMSALIGAGGIGEDRLSPLSKIAKFFLLCSFVLMISSSPRALQAMKAAEGADAMESSKSMNSSKTIHYSKTMNYPNSMNFSTTMNSSTAVNSSTAMISSTAVKSLKTIQASAAAPSGHQTSPPGKETKATMGSQTTIQRRPKDLLELRALTYEGLLDEQQLTPLRQKAQREAALGVAAQAGARWRYATIIEEILIPMEAQLDSLFNFEHLVSQKGPLVILPPVVTAAGEAMRLNNPSQGSAQEKSYRFVRPAMLVSIKPNWRHYLMNLPSGPSSIHPTLRPQTGEVAKWKIYVDDGWEMGVKQADRLFEANANLLARDFAGMMMFKRLVEENLALAPLTEEKLIELEVHEQEMVFNKSIFQLNEKGRFIDPKRKTTRKSQKTKY
jgi:defect-in-organelle-trafficking protein DotC